MMHTQQPMQTKSPIVRQESRRRQRGAIPAAILYIVGFIVLVVATLGTLLYVFGKTVPPGYMGLRQTDWQTYVFKEGFEDDGYSPGLYLTIPRVSRVHLIPEGVRILELQGPDSLKVTTVEGAMVDVDVTLVYRVNRVSSETMSGPGTLARSLTISKPERWDNHVRNVIEEDLLDALAKLSASDFYIPEKRLKSSMAAEVKARETLGKIGIYLDSVLIRHFDYERSEIEAAIFAKNLEVKQKELNEALSHLAEVKAELANTEAIMQAEVGVTLTKGREESKVILSQARLSEAEQVAKGDEAVAIAKGKVKELQAAVLTRKESATRLIAEQMAPLLSSLKGGIISEIDPYDVHAWAERLGVESEQTDGKMQKEGVTE